MWLDRDGGKRCVHPAPDVGAFFFQVRCMARIGEGRFAFRDHWARQPLATPIATRYKGHRPPLTPPDCFLLVKARSRFAKVILHEGEEGHWTRARSDTGSRIVDELDWRRKDTR